MLQRFYHQQNQLRERDRERRIADKQFNFHLSNLTSASGHNYQYNNERMSNTNGRTVSPTMAEGCAPTSNDVESNASKEDQGKFA